LRILNDQDKAADNVDGTESKPGNLVSFEIDFDTLNSGNWCLLGRKIREVSYAVYMPAGNSLAIKNSYGNIALPDF
jgi:hypothetical protein